MCELLGMSSDLPTTLSLAVTKLAEHGGPPTSIRDGWGIAYYEGADVCLIKDAQPANDSDWVRFVRDHDLRSSIAMAHIRRATVGEPAYRNTQPFARELAGRMHLFAHNGWLPGILNSSRFRFSQYSPVGETDSEQAFCALLERLRDIWRQPGDIPPLETRLAVVSSFARDLKALGPANFLYSDGDALFAHGDRRKQASTAKIEPPGLVFLQRWCRQDKQELVASGISVDGADQTVTLVASVALSEDSWQAFDEGEVIAISHGRVVSRRLDRFHG